MIAVIGCGNPNRQDDGTGPAVIAQLHALGLASAGVKLLDAGTDGMAVMFAARGCKTLVVVDAASTGAEPGTVYEVPGERLQRAYKPGLNLHDFRWEAALHAGRMIFRDDFPSDVVVLLVEARELGFGIGLSEPVGAVVSKVAQRIAALIAGRLVNG